ncbi:unnamed protein product [Adineta steineri]|uniref:Uncharacterized protein n=1 Tax=Adineta steineri TaxID=433720 RepID=A0A814FKZ6_9BILA|nr:unnamed protein product [Adineta steineri]CAF3927969.1 unnamed protein product [Adineta steineri]
MSSTIMLVFDQSTLEFFVHIHCSSWIVWRSPRQRPSIDAVTIRVSWKQRARTMVKIIRDSFVDLNLFKSSLRQQPSDIKQQRWTTRIYIALLTLALIILTLHGILSFETKLIEISKPSLSTVQQLQSQANIISSLQCPCTQLTVPYGQFIQLQPLYHQVCSSDFVTDDWIISINDLAVAVFARNVYSLTVANTFQLSQPPFVLLQALCLFSNKTIAGALQTFQNNTLVGAQLLTLKDFTNQISSDIHQFELETTNTFIHFIQLLRNITHVNQFMSGSSSNYDSAMIALPNNYLTSISITTYTTSNGNSSDTCSCANDTSCKIQWGLFTGLSSSILVYPVPGFYFGCQLVDSLLQSTLECFYDNQDCMRIIIDFYNVSTFGNVTRLNSSFTGSRFAINSTIESLVSQMFIESWSNSTNYSSYFTQCQPASCSYTISQRNNLVETITRIVGLIGASPRARFVTVGIKIRDWFKKVNVFDDTNRAVSIEQQCLATRVYILTLIISLIILVIYTSLTYYLNTFTITNPSLEQYKHLQERYGLAAVSCVCSQSSIPYSTFIELECDFHPVCTSHFVSDSYLQELFELYNALDTTYASSHAYTLQGTIFTHFQTLLALCNLARDFVSDAQQQYLASSVVSTYISDFDLFETETNTSLANFRTTLPNSFVNSLQMIRGLMQGNGFVSAYSTNWYPFTYIIVNRGLIYFKPQYYGSDRCSCATSATCTQPSTPFVHGYLVGCTPLESLLQSTIECLYEQSCVDLLGTYLNMSLSNSSISLNKNETRFSSTNTTDSIVQQMFVETCSSNVSYNQYFEQCKPDSCSVTLFESGSFIIVVTTILGLYGGLTTFLKLLVPFLVFSTYKLIPAASSNNNTTTIVNTDHEEHLPSTTVALRSVPEAPAPLTRFFTSIPRYIKILFGLILFILVATVIVVPSVFLTRQDQKQSTLTIKQCTNLTFATAVSYAVGAYPIIVTVNDFNGDGILDLANFNALGNTVSVLLGIGNGKFGLQATFPVGSFPVSIAVGDFNSDGPLDLAVINQNDNTVSVLLGTGSGSFGQQIIYSTGLYPLWVVAKDVNTDGRLDLVIVNGYSGNVGVMLGTGNGDFISQATYTTFGNPSRVAVDDFDGDGCLDLMVISSTWPLMSILLGTGNGGFRSQTMLSYGLTWFSIATGDFNGDGRLDVVVTNNLASTPRVGILPGTGNGSFGLQPTFLTGIAGGPVIVAIGDFNGDARLDLVVTFGSLASVGVFLGAGNGSFRLPTMFSIGSGSIAYGVAVGDFNNDGRLDIAVSDDTYNTMNILLNTCT